jgi:hypothetical protein
MSETVLNSFFGWQGACLCTVFRKGWKFYNPNRGKRRCLFPRSAEMGTGRSLLVGSVPRLSGCVATALLSTLPPCGSNFFGPGDGDGHLSIKIMSITAPLPFHLP